MEQIEQNEQNGMDIRLTCEYELQKSLISFVKVLLLLQFERCSLSGYVTVTAYMQFQMHKTHCASKEKIIMHMYTLESWFILCVRITAER